VSDCCQHQVSNVSALSWWEQVSNVSALSWWEQVSNVSAISWWEQVSNVSAISWWEQDTFQWDDDVYFVLDQHLVEFLY
jgi:hypothetical protein